MKKVIVIALVIITSLTLVAQPARKGNKKPADPKKIFEKVLDIDEDEFGKFMEVYNAYKLELRDIKIKPENCPIKSKGGSKVEFTDEQAEELILSKFEENEKVLEVKKDYYNKFKKILSPSDILKVYRVEQKMQQARENQGHQGGQQSAYQGGRGQQGGGRRPQGGRR